MKKVLSLLLPLIGITFAFYWVKISANKPTAAPPLNPPVENNSGQTIAGSGIVEAASRNITLAPPIPGQVVKLFVKENDLVKKDLPLYQIDDREQRARLASAEAEIAHAQASLFTAQTDIANQQAAETTARAKRECFCG